MKKSTLSILICALFFGSIICMSILTPEETQEEMNIISDCNQGSMAGFFCNETGGQISYSKGKLGLGNAARIYLEQLDYCSMPTIECDLNYLLDTMKFPSDAERQFFRYLTDTLAEHRTFKDDEFESDLLMNQLIFGERAAYYATIKPKYSLFFSALGQFWMNKVANHLTSLNEIESDLKYNLNFMQIANRCAQNKYYISRNYTYLDKIVQYAIQKKFGYLWFRFWNNTGMGVKTLVLLIIVSGIWAYGLLINQIVHKLKRK